MDVGLREEGDAEAVAHEDLSDDGDAGVGGVDVGVARDEDDVGRVPAARAHLLLGGGKKHGEDYTTKWALDRAMEWMSDATVFEKRTGNAVFRSEIPRSVL